MKSERTVELIERVYWRCMVEAHRHGTEDVANACIARELDRRSSRPRPIKWDEAKEARVIEQRDSGLTFVQIGIEWGVTRARAKAVYDAAILRRKRHALYAESVKAGKGSQFDRLSTRTRNCLMAEGLSSDEAVREYLRASSEQITKIPNLGPRGVKEVLDAFAKRPT